MESHRRGGVVLRVDTTLYFIPAATAVHVGPVPLVTAIPGAPPELVGVAMHEGTIVPVVSVGSGGAEMVVCQHAGELLGVIGAEVVHAGLLEVAPERPDQVRHDGQPVRPLDLASIYARVQSSQRSARWGA
jgi:hypothetical protein